MAGGAEFRGPLFDGRAQAAFADYAEDLEAEIAQEGVDLVQRYLGVFLRHPTGYYQSRIRVEQRGTRHMVTDSGVVYGPWLAGVSERNRATRFKGYKHWRLATQDLESRSGAIAQRLMPRLLRRIS
jgi:hypothetical protein